MKKHASNAWKSNPYFIEGTEERERAMALRHNQKHHDKASARMKELNSQLTLEECRRRRAKSFATHPEMRQKIREARWREWEKGEKDLAEFQAHAIKYFGPHNERRHREKVEREEAKTRAEKNISLYTNNPRIKALPKQDKAYYDEISEFFGDAI